jgi:hypothetical protein
MVLGMHITQGVGVVLVMGPGMFIASNAVRHACEADGNYPPGHCDPRIG